MSIIQITKSKIEENKLGLQAILEDETIPQQYTLKELISEYFYEIEQLTKRFGSEKTVELLKDQNIEISANTLKQYMSEIRKDVGTKKRKTSKKVEGKKQQKPTPESAVEQVESEETVSKLSGKKINTSNVDNEFNIDDFG